MAKEEQLGEVSSGTTAGEQGAALLGRAEDKRMRALREHQEGARGKNTLEGARRKNTQEDARRQSIPERHIENVRQTRSSVRVFTGTCTRSSQKVFTEGLHRRSSQRVFTQGAREQAQQGCFRAAHHDSCMAVRLRGGVEISIAPPCNLSLDASLPAGLASQRLPFYLESVSHRDPPPFAHTADVATTRHFDRL